MNGTVLIIASKMYLATFDQTNDTDDYFRNHRIDVTFLDELGYDSGAPFCSKNVN
jgi:hypothetical protein